MTATDTNKKKVPSGQQIALILFVIVAGFFLFTEHRAHILGVLPWLILLLCPLMHFFMHRGHGHGDHSEGHGNHQKHGGES